MHIEAPAVVYFINEKYGVVMKANANNKEVSLWDSKRKAFTNRIDIGTAGFIATTDQVDGVWCAAHPTYSLETAQSAARKIKHIGLPSEDGMTLARAAKRVAMGARMRTESTKEIAADLRAAWHNREKRLAA